MHTRSLITLYIVIFTAAAAQAKLETCDFFLRLNLIKSEQRVRANLYTQNRSFRGDPGSYQTMLGDAFVDDALALSESAHWLDMGAGAGIAQFQFLKHRWRKSQSVPYTTAVNVVTPELYIQNQDRLRSLMPLDKHKLLEGVVAEIISTEHVRQVDLLTDVFGALSYTADLSRTLKNELSLLNTGGRFYLYFKSKYTYFYSKDGHRLSFVEYLQRIQGIRIEVMMDNSYRITRTTDALKVPELALTQFIDDMPPHRTFQMTGSVQK